MSKSKNKKRYFVEFESDKYDPKAYDREKEDYGSYNHYYGSHASTLKTAIGYIGKIRKEYANDNPHNFRVYDTLADVDPITNHVPCIYHED